MGAVPMRPVIAVIQLPGASSATPRWSRRRSRLRPPLRSPRRPQENLCRATALDPAAHHPTARHLADELEHMVARARMPDGHNRSPVRRATMRPGYSFVVASCIRGGGVENVPARSSLRVAHRSAASCRGGVGSRARSPAAGDRQSLNTSPTTCPLARGTVDQEDQRCSA